MGPPAAYIIIFGADSDTLHPTCLFPIFLTKSGATCTLLALVTHNCPLSMDNQSYHLTQSFASSQTQMERN